MFRVHHINTHDISIRNLILLFLTIVMGFASLMVLGQVSIDTSIQNARQTIGQVTITSDGTDSGEVFWDFNYNGNGATYVSGLQAETSFSGRVLGINDNGDLIYVFSNNLVISGAGGGVGGGDGYWTGYGNDIWNINAGNVGIGTSTMSGKLHIAGSGDTDIYIQETSINKAANINFKNTTRTWTVGADSYPDIFYIGIPGLNQFISIIPTGEVGIGTTGPKATLQVIGNFIAGDYSNTIPVMISLYSSVLGGSGNNIGYAEYSTIGGGLQNNIYKKRSFIGGGKANSISGSFGGVNFDSSIVGGLSNTIEAAYSFIGGGWQNKILSALEAASTIGGGIQNIIAGVGMNTIAGGQQNTISGSSLGSFIGGGGGNIIKSGNVSMIGGGDNNKIISGDRSTIGGGFQNMIRGSVGFIGGGFQNTITGEKSTIGGGRINYISGDYSTIGGGNGHYIRGDNGFIGGGNSNHIFGGGVFGTIGGGMSNDVSGYVGFIGGGVSNKIYSNSSIIGGGGENRIGGNRSTIAGGYRNRVYSTYSFIGGGGENGITGASDYSTIVGGYNNTITNAKNSFAAGTRAKIINNNSFVWNSNTSSDFTTTHSGQFLINAPYNKDVPYGGVGINTNNPQSALDVSGNINAIEIFVDHLHVASGSMLGYDAQLAPSSVNTGGGCAVGEAGTIIYKGGSFYGCNGSLRKKLDN